jgi:hypothetical protein
VAFLAGWEVPQVSTINIPEGFPWVFGTDEFDDLVQKSYGLNLGLQFLPETTAVAIHEWSSIPEQALARMVALDIFFCNYDRIAQSQNILKDSTGKYWLIDHGSCLIFPEVLSSAPLSLPQNHFLKKQESQYFSKELLKELTKQEYLFQAVQELPQSWLDEAQISSSQILHPLIARATSFS